jgi:hypothetical protein
MPDPAERFLAAATAPLGDNAELQAMARRELETCLTAGDEKALAMATKRLEAGGGGGQKWKTGFFMLTAVVSIMTLGLAGRDAAHYLELLNIIELSGSGPSEKRIEALLSKELTADQRLLLFGDTSKSLPSERMKALWDSDPGNPAYFADYTIRFIRDHERIPPDFLATAAKLDPDNAWFTLAAAAASAKGSVEKKIMSIEDRKAGKPPAYAVLDAARLEETLRLLAKAAGQKGFDSYRDDLLAARIRLLPKRSDVASQVIPLAHVGAPPWTTYAFVRLSEAVAAAASVAEGNGDAEGFQKLAADWDRCLELDAQEESGSVWNSRFREAAVAVTSRTFAVAAEALGLDATKQKWGSRAAQLEKIKAEREALGTGEGIEVRSSMITGLYLSPLVNQTARAPGITDGDLKPARLADHELFSRLAAAAVMLALGLILSGATLYRFRGHELVRRLSRSMEKLLQPADRVWILGGGIVLPFVWQIVIQRLTSMGARDWSIAASGFLIPSGQVAATGFLMVVLPVMIARWRLGRRAVMLGWRKGRSWPGWAAVICGAISLPVFGLGFANGKRSETVMMIAATLLGILVFAWLVTGIRAVFSKRTALLRRVTLSRVLVPAYALGMLLMAASMPLYHAAEKRWLAQDRLMEITPEAPALSRYEWMVAQAMRAELLEILNTK